MAKRKTTKIRFLKGELLLWVVIVFMMIGIPVFKVYSSALLSETNIKVERLRKDIAKQEGRNDSLGMKINELSSLDKIQEVAIANGLSYNNDNIKVIITE